MMMMMMVIGRCKIFFLFISNKKNSFAPAQALPENLYK